MTDSSITKYDNALFGILQNEGDIVPFIEAMFSFLYRRTDFFKIQHDASEKIGFPKGFVEKIVQNIFYKFYHQALVDDEMLQNRLKEITVSEEVPYVRGKSLDPTVTSDGKPLRRIAKRRSTAKKETLSVELTQNDFQRNCDSYNGALREKYSWSQTIKDIDARVFVPSYIVSGKSVDVHINSGSLEIRLLDNGDWKELLGDRLTGTINVDECMWTLVPGEYIHLNLEKSKESWWTSLITSEPSIDVKHIDASRPLEDLDEETQMKIFEVAYNQEQKRLGKPTTDQMKVEEVLKEAWNKEGSVFKGQPFDPSLVEIVTSTDTVS